MDDHARPAPNHDTEDPRGKDTGHGYPEENQPGTSPGAPPEREHDTTPRTENPDGHPGQATGNPRAAGAKHDDV